MSEADPIAVDSTDSAAVAAEPAPAPAAEPALAPIAEATSDEPHGSILIFASGNCMTGPISQLEKLINIGQARWATEAEVDLNQPKVTIL